MTANQSAVDVVLDIIRRQLQQPDLSLAQARQMPFAKMLLDTVAEWTPGTSSETGEAEGASDAALKLTASPAALRAAIEDTFVVTDLSSSEAERAALLSVSDIVMISAQRRLRLRDAVRAEILDAAIGSEPYETLLRQAGEADMEDHAAIGRDPIRLPSAWLRCFLSGDFGSLDTAPPSELKAALAARERLRLVSRLGPSIPTLDDLRRRVSLAELLEPLRLLTGERGGWDGTPRRDRFVGRKDELETLRAFVDELWSRGAREFLSRSFAKAKRALTGAETPGLAVVTAEGGLGKSTLLAKFVLDHALGQSRRFPFAYLDFDRAGIDAERPHQLLIEIARQVGLQFPDAQPQLDALREQMRAELVSAPLNASTAATSEIQDPFSRFAEILREHATFGSRAFLLVLDTLEVVQWHSSAIDQLAVLVDEFRRKGLDELRVVASGRADVPELRGQLPALDIPLKPLLVGEAREMADALGRAAIGRDWSWAWSTAIAGTRTQSNVRREPLSVRVAVDLVIHAVPSERQAIVNEIAAKGLDAELSSQISDDEAAESAQHPRHDFVGRLYERRIVRHVRDRDARKLAWPGLVVRRITLEIARDLLAEFCGIPPEAAGKAFTALGQEIWMVIPEGDALRHQPVLRARTLPLMRRKDPEKFNAIARAAVKYFADHRSRSREDHVEWIYHRFLAGEAPESIEPDTTLDVLSLVAKAEADFSIDSAAASYLAVRTARSRLSPHRIRSLTTNDAVYHLSDTSVSSFSFDDVAVDAAVLDVSNRLAADPRLRPELRPWARALQIKTGAWRILPRMLDWDQTTPNEISLAHMFWAARSPGLGGERLAEFATQWAAALSRASPAPGHGFRTSVQLMALMRIGSLASFADIDWLVANMLSQMRPDPRPSTQAALRTAIVFGERSRVPAIRLWLASRRRGAAERVRNPTISTAELRALMRLQPNASELRLTRENDPDAPTRVAEERTVAAACAAIEDILDEVAKQDEGLRALSRVFAARDEDWIVPMGYAATRARAGALSGALFQRLATYQAPFEHGSPGRETPNDMIGAMRLADEAGDLLGCCELVLAECDPAARVTYELRFLLDCRGAWHRRIDEIIGTGDLSPVEATPLASSERPPDPGPILHRDDPQKERWGGLEARDGRAVRAVLESIERGIFYFSIIVESTDGSTLASPVVFHLHDSYPRSVQTIRRILDGRQARLSGWSADGVFAIGVQVKDASGNWISLELDLAQLPGLPKRFREA